MTKSFKLAGAAVLAFALASQPVFAQARKPATAAPAAAQPAAPRGAIVPGVAVANLDAVIVSSNAYRVGMQNLQAQYKGLLDAAEARAKQIDAQLSGLINQFNADRAAKKPDATLQAEASQIQRVKAEGEEEIARMLAPVELAKAYIVEQITDKLPQAIQNVINKRGITILLRPESIYFANQAYDVSPAILQELNAILPSVQTIPPQGWLPREMREQQQQQGGAPQPRPAAPAPATTGTQPAPRPAGPQPEGR